MMNNYKIIRIILTLLFLFIANQGFSQGQSSEVTVFYDGFVDNNNDWPIKSSSDVSFNIYGGFYYFEHLRTTKGWSVHKTIIVEEDRNFKIEAGIKKISGIQNNGFGLVYGRQDNDNKNTFLISGNGYFKIKSTIKGKSTDIKGWTKVSAINEGNGQYNTLKIP